MDRVALKTKAKAQIKGKIGILFVITLVIGIVSSVASGVLALIPVVGSLLATIIVTPAFALSMVRVYLLVIKDQKPEVKDAFSGFDDFWSAFKVTLLVGLFTFLWSLLFIIPGIVKSISYSMSMFILAENKGKSALECINESKQMTEGHKAELFFSASILEALPRHCMKTEVHEASLGSMKNRAKFHSLKSYDVCKRPKPS